jgi:hypothetical protein
MTHPFDGFVEFNNCPHLTDYVSWGGCPYCEAPIRERTPDYIPRMRATELEDVTEEEILDALDVLDAA